MIAECSVTTFTTSEQTAAHGMRARQAHPSPFPQDSPSTYSYSGLESRVCPSSLLDCLRALSNPSARKTGDPARVRTCTGHTPCGGASRLGESWLRPLCMPVAHPQLLSPGPNPEGQQGLPHPQPEANKGSRLRLPRHPPVVTQFCHCHGAQPQDLGPEPRCLFRGNRLLSGAKARTMCTAPVVVRSLGETFWQRRLRGRELPGLGDLWAFQRSLGAQR